MRSWGGSGFALQSTSANFGSFFSSAHGSLGCGRFFPPSCWPTASASPARTTTVSEPKATLRIIQGSQPRNVESGMRNWELEYGIWNGRFLIPHSHSLFRIPHSLFLLFRRYRSTGVYPVPQSRRRIDSVLDFRDTR